MTSSAPRRATYDDVLASPSNVVAEVVHGVLYPESATHSQSA